MEIETVLDAGATIGESPTWAALENALYWIDIKRPALYRYEPETGAQKSWTMPSDIGAFALVSKPAGAVVALRTGIFLLEFDSGSLVQLSRPPFDPNLFRFNEGTCDATGRFWIGVMFDPLNRNHAPQASSLHNFTLGDGLRSQPDVAELHNGMAWNGDGSRFYLSHSNQGEVFAYSFDPADLVRVRYSHRFRKHSEYPTAPRSIATEDTGVLCTVVADCGATQLRASLTVISSCPSASRRCAPLPGSTWTYHKRLGQADYAATSERTPCWRAIAASSRREGHSPALLRSVTSTC